MPCDREFGTIKRALKNFDRIYSLHELTGIAIQSSTKGKFTVKEEVCDKILEFKKWWPKFFKEVVSQKSKTRQVPKDKKVSFYISKFMHYTYNSEFPSQVVARHFIEPDYSHIQIESTWCMC